MKQQMWTDTQGEMTASCFFDTDKGLYEVEVVFKGKKKSRTFPCSFTPYFGMDVVDQSESGKIAEELAQEHEKEAL